MENNLSKLRRNLLIFTGVWFVISAMVFFCTQTYLTLFFLSIFFLLCYFLASLKHRLDDDSPVEKYMITIQMAVIVVASVVLFLSGLYLVVKHGFTARFNGVVKLKDYLGGLEVLFSIGKGK